VVMIIITTMNHVIPKSLDVMVMAAAVATKSNIIPISDYN